MTERKERTFADVPAVRAAVPLLIGLTGPSGSGKTYSALRLATGIQKVVGGDIFAIDSEANRMLHYADKFKFRHVPFVAPFDPLSYLDALKYCANKGAKTIIIDSTSHLHEGPGGTLEEHSEEQERLAKLWKSSLDAVNMAAWAKPKQKLRSFLNEMLQLKINIIFCFRAKEKVDMTGGKPVNKGFQPIIGDEFFYEMTVNFLLYPISGGVPTWVPGEKGEKSVIKLPEQFKSIFTENRQLDESIGVELAKWSSGKSVVQKPVDPPPAKSDVTTAIHVAETELDRMASEGFDDGFSLSSEQPAKLSNREELLRVMKKYQTERLMPQVDAELGDSLILWLEGDKGAENDIPKWQKSLKFLTHIERKIPADFLEPHFTF